eukprot:353793-Chlamydomonas_euryale.AAC.4
MAVLQSHAVQPWVDLACSSRARSPLAFCGPVLRPLRVAAVTNQFNIAQPCEMRAPVLPSAYDHGSNPGKAGPCLCAHGKASPGGRGKMIGGAEGGVVQGHIIGGAEGGPANVSLRLLLSAVPSPCLLRPCNPRPDVTLLRSSPCLSCPSNPRPDVIKLCSSPCLLRPSNPRPDVIQLCSSPCLSRPSNPRPEISLLRSASCPSPPFLRPHPSEAMPASRSA